MFLCILFCVIIL